MKTSLSLGSVYFMQTLRKLSSAHKKYCRLRASGRVGQLRCYRTAFPECKEYTSAISAAFRLERDPLIQARIKKLVDKMDHDLIMSKQEICEFLSRVVRTPIGDTTEFDDLANDIKRNFDLYGFETSQTLKLPSKIQAIQELSKLDGHYEPEKHKMDLLGGVMLVPDSGKSLEDFEKEVAARQAKLKQDAAADRNTP